MRIFNVFILLLLCTNTYAGKLIFSNNNEQVDITGDVTIDNQQGNVTVTTAGGDYLIVGDDQPVILGFYPDDYEIVNGSTIQANWTVVNADDCVATTPSGSSSWSGPKASIDGNNQEAGVSINQLPSTLSLACSNSNGSVTKSFQIVAQPVTSTGNPSIDTFTVNSQPAFVTVSSENNIANFEWSASDVSSCTASASPALAGWNGTKAITGSENIAITQTTTVTLTCDSVAPRNITINYSVGGDPNCAGVQFPTLSPNKVEMTYAEANDGFNFGESTGATLVESFRKDQFLALSGFFTNETNYRRRIDNFTAPTNQRPAYGIYYSVSECAGDFSPSATCQGLMVPNVTSLFFSTRASDIGNATYCNLEVGKIYYLNFVHDVDPNDNGNQPRCAFPSDQSCAIFTSEIDINQ